MDLPALRSALTSAAHALPAPEAFAAPEAREAARRLGERLRRDLLPRLSGPGQAPVLLVAIAGPNNVGKSTLFNTLAGGHLSPARPEGGLTKQCLAAAHPATWERPGAAAGAAHTLQDFLRARYEVQVVESGAAAPVDVAGPPGRLYLVLSEAVAPGLVLLDTPDFDSVYRDNRERAEALLVTVDVVAFVTSRQTYQNAALVDFLRDAVGRGRPYLLVYNEAGREEVARGHLEKLSGDVGQAPLARYLAPHQPEVETGAPLRTQPLDGAPPLATLLSDAGHAAQLKARALQASLADARAELHLLARAAGVQRAEPERLRSELRHGLFQVGARAALKAVPADVLIDAFRDELDARSAFHRMVRLPFRGLATALTWVGRQVRSSFTGPPPPQPLPRDATEGALRDGVRRLVEALAPEVAAWRGSPEGAELLRATLGPTTLQALDGKLELEGEPALEADRATLYQYCRELVGKELEAGGAREGALQALTTLVYSVPSGAAALVTVGTGGLGHDAVIWAGTLLSTPLLERFVDLLGADIRTRVTERWSEAHGTTLARALETRLFGPLLAHLDDEVRRWETVEREMEAGADRL